MRGVKTVTFYPSTNRAGRSHPHGHHRAAGSRHRRSSGGDGRPPDHRDAHRRGIGGGFRRACAASLRCAADEVRNHRLGRAGPRSRSRASAGVAELRDILIWSPTRAHAEACAGELGGSPAAIEEAAAADVVLTATLSTQPVLQGRWLKPDALVLAVGGIGPMNRELDDEVMHTCFLVAESRDCVARESGDVIGFGATIHAEIGEILARPGATVIPKTGRVLFKTVGMAIEDLTAARLLVRRGPAGFLGALAEKVREGRRRTTLKAGRCGCRDVVRRRSNQGASGRHHCQ